MIARLTAGLAAAMALTTPLVANGQAFVQPKGQGRVIASAIYSNSSRGFDDNADTSDIPNYEKAELYLISEYGLTDDLTLLVTPSLRHVGIEGERDSDGLGYLDLGARYRLVQSGPFTVSAQALVRLPGNDRRDLPAQLGATDTEYDLRGQAAMSFGSGSFVIGEASYRRRDGDPPDEGRFDATLGIRAAPRVLLIANSFNTWSLSRGRGVFGDYRYHNLYLSAAYDVSPRVTVQFGAQGTVAGRNALRERGFFGGLWFRF